MLCSGFPKVLVDLKKRLVEHWTVLPKENPGSLWPKTTLAPLKDDQRLTPEQLQRLLQICRSACLAHRGEMRHCGRTFRSVQTALLVQTSQRIARAGVADCRPSGAGDIHLQVRFISSQCLGPDHSLDVSQCDSAGRGSGEGIGTSDGRQMTQSSTDLALRGIPSRREIP